MHVHTIIKGQDRVSVGEVSGVKEGIHGLDGLGGLWAGWPSRSKAGCGWGENPTGQIRKVSPPVGSEYTVAVVS